MASGSVLRRSGNPARLAGELAHLLVQARGERTRQAIADAAGVHPNTLGDLEHGRANPTLAYLEALGAVYGIRLSLVVDMVPGARAAATAGEAAERKAQADEASSRARAD